MRSCGSAILRIALFRPDQQVPAETGSHNPLAFNTHRIFVGDHRTRPADPSCLGAICRFSVASTCRVSSPRGYPIPNTTLCWRWPQPGETVTAGWALFLASFPGDWQGRIHMSVAYSLGMICPTKVAAQPAGNAAKQTRQQSKPMARGFCDTGIFARARIRRNGTEKQTGWFCWM